MVGCGFFCNYLLLLAAFQKHQFNPHVLDKCKRQIPTSRGQEEGTCLGSEGKIWRLAKSHGDSAPPDRYPETTLIETARKKGLAPTRPLLTLINTRTRFKIGRKQSYRQSMNRQHVKDVCPSNQHHYHSDGKQQRKRLPTVSIFIL